MFLKSVISKLFGPKFVAGKCNFKVDLRLFDSVICFSCERNSSMLIINNFIGSENYVFAYESRTFGFALCICCVHLIVCPSLLSASGIVSESVI